jgi:hypothetical protein
MESSHMKIMGNCLRSLFIFLLLVFSPSCKKEKPNILLVTVDTLRRDHVGVYGYPRQTTPFLDSLAKNGMVFKNAITPIPSTAASHTSILTSLHPLIHDVLLNASWQSGKLNTLSKVLQKNGYYTIGTIAVFHMAREYNFNQGFDSFSDKWVANSRTKNKTERPAGSVNQSLFKQIEKYHQQYKSKPLFIWVHYFDPHFPYKKRRKYSCSEPIPKSVLAKIDPGQDYNKFSFTEAAGMIDAYDSEIKYTDAAIGNLFFFLQKLGIAKNMITCITADHGEQLGEHGFFGGHADFYAENIFVPLILHGFRVPKNVNPDRYVSTMDIAPTILNEAGLPATGFGEGENLLAGGSRPEAPLRKTFFIIGNPIYTRSLQLIDPATAKSFIKNFDHHMKFVYIDEGNVLPAAKFSECKPDALRVDQKNERIKISIPYSIRKGMNFLALKLDFEKNNGFSIENKFDERIKTPGVLFRDNKKQLLVYYPVTLFDDLILTLDLLPGTKLSGSSYAFIAADEFLKIKTVSKTLKKMDNLSYLKYCLTSRKNNPGDEVYDLNQDMKMDNNLFSANGFQFENLLYAGYQDFIKKRNRIFFKTNKEKKYSGDEMENLKLLGYL